MKLSAPLYRLKRRARLLSREARIPLHVALDRIAAQEGFAGWSLLAARAAAAGPAPRIFAALAPGELLLVGARPGQGKTLLGLQLAVEAMKHGNRGAFFTLEYVEQEVAARFRDIGADSRSFGGLFDFDASDRISAGHIAAALDGAPRSTLCVIDYLQLLDQRRENPPLGEQVAALRSFARQRGHILVFLSQIDRHFDPERKSCPDLRDVRLPNPLDLSLFDRNCFLHEGEVRLGTA